MEPKAQDKGSAGDTNDDWHTNPFLSAIGRIIRVVTIIPVVATLLTAVALMLYGAYETWHFIDGLFFAEHKLDREETLLLALEIVDLFLLATVVEVVALGLYQLYFDQDLRLPQWLTIRSLDDLKSKLVGVVVTVLAVYFLGQAVGWANSPNIVYLGGAVAMVIAALTYFLSKIGH